MLCRGAYAKKQHAMRTRKTTNAKPDEKREWRAQHTQRSERLRHPRRYDAVQPRKTFTNRSSDLKLFSPARPSTKNHLPLFAFIRLLFIKLRQRLVRPPALSPHSSCRYLLPGGFDMRCFAVAYLRSAPHEHVYERLKRRERKKNTTRNATREKTRGLRQRKMRLLRA